jgi:hypothetical protein
MTDEQIMSDEEFGPEFDYEAADAKLREIFAEAESLLSEEKFEMIFSLVRDGQEWELAYEILCEVFEDMNQAISPRLYSLLEEAFQIMNLEKAHHLRLKVI